jgi:Bacterial Ig domain/Bacterial Ig-like domain (group 3)
VLRRTSATTLTCATPITTGEKSHCTATVSDGSGGQVITPVGTVRFALDGAGAASCALARTSGSTSTCEVDVTPTAETHQVSAAYAGDVDHQTSSSAPFTIVAQPKSVPEPEPTPEPTPEPEPAPEPEPVVDTVAPVVTITSPADGSSIKKGRKLIITATATDETGVTRVDFASNGKVVCSDTTPGSWTCSWNVAKNSSDGGFDVMVTAYDAAGNSASRGISVKVITGRA